MKKRTSYFVALMISISLVGCGGSDSPSEGKFASLPKAEVTKERAIEMVGRVNEVIQNVTLKAQSQFKASTATTSGSADIDCKDGGTASAEWDVDLDDTSNVSTNFVIGLDSCKHGKDTLDGRVEYDVRAQTGEGELALESHMKGNLSLITENDGVEELTEITQDVSFAIDLSKRTCSLDGEVTANGETFEFDNGSCDLGKS